MSDLNDGGPGIEITTLAKRAGPLTKRIALDTDDKLVSDGSACVMGSGQAWRTTISDMGDLARHIASLRPSEAIALGRLRDGLPDKVTITTKTKLDGKTSNVIARTLDFIRYQPGAPALLLIDVDTKGMPDSVRARVKAQLGAVSAIASVVQALGSCGCVVRNSTTTGIRNTDTGKSYPGSEGRHVYVLVRDGADIERGLRVLHDRLWLNGFGWMMVGEAGQLLERSLADRMVFSAERLVFEAPPVVVPPLVQDRASRMPEAREGEPLDTATAIPDLTPDEAKRLKQLKAAERERLKPECAKARAAWIDARTEELVQRGVMPAEARATAERAADGGVLLPDFVLLFDLPEFVGCPVGDVLADPERFVGATMADPLEGIEYGRTKAKIMRRPDGSLWIHSFAHGRATYELKHSSPLPPKREPLETKEEEPETEPEPEAKTEPYGPPTLADLSIDDLAAMDAITFGKIAKPKAALLGAEVKDLTKARTEARTRAREARTRARAEAREAEARRTRDAKAAERLAKEAEKARKTREKEADVDAKRKARARQPDWLKQLALDSHGNPIPDLANTMIALREGAELRNLLAYDEMARVPVLLHPVPGAKNTATPHPLNDIDVTAIQNWIQGAAIRRLAKDVVHQATELQANQHRFHPVRHYLDSLKWDGKNRLNTWLTYYLGVERIDQTVPIGEDYVDAIGRMFLISGVARIFNPGCQCDYMLVLEGPQGNLKSSACAILAGEWFSDHLPDLHSSQKDVSQHLNGKWIVEIPELAALLRADESLIKSFISRRVERYRRSYGRRDVFEPRQCIFIGTTNLEAYLRDPTGGRRFWPVKVIAIDLEALKHERDQLWAEAVVRYRRGERYWPDAQLERDLIQKQQEARFDEDAWTDVIRTHLRGESQTTVMRVAVALGFTNDRVGTRDQRRISAILERLGWVRRRTDTQRLWVPRTIVS